MNRRQAGAVLATATGALGLIDLALVCRQIGIQEGLTCAAHDPGKFFFHVVLLPIAVLALTFSFPVGVLERVWSDRRKRMALVVVATALISSAAIYGGSDAVRGFERRAPWPADVRKSIVAGALDAPTYLARERALLRAEVRAKSKHPSVARAEYTQRVEALLGVERDYWSQSSFRAKWAGGLTILGATFAGVILATIGVLVLARALERETVRALSLIVMLLSTWLLFRGYSEWWGNLGELSFGTYTPFVIVGIAIGVATFFLWLLHEWKHPIAVAAGTLGAGVAVVAGIEKFKPEWVAAVAIAVSDYSWSEMLVIYTALGLCSAGLVYLLWPDS
ncbi:MAG: hypothetical protein HZA52_17820 [Planctomycetes bacterium]|nr:hypothetical protein [Planctomycetota bacterium]